MKMIFIGKEALISFLIFLLTAVSCDFFNQKPEEESGDFVQIDSPVWNNSNLANLPLSVSTWTHFEYDEQTFEILPVLEWELSHTLEYQFNAQGQMTLWQENHTDGVVLVDEYIYADGKMTRATWKDVTTDTPDDLVVRDYQYTAQGFLTQMTETFDPGYYSSREFFYDERGLRTNETFVFYNGDSGAGPQQRTEYEYDAHSRLVSREHFDEEDQLDSYCYYTYSQGLLQEMVKGSKNFSSGEWTVETTSFLYNSRGLLIQEIQGENLIVDYFYNDQGVLTEKVSRYAQPDDILGETEYHKKTTYQVVDQGGEVTWESPLGPDPLYTLQSYGFIREYQP